LKRRYRLAVISNIDDDLFAETARLLPVELDHLITAQQVGSYKPSLRNFEVGLDRIGEPRERVLHVAQSLHHDIAPARQMGLATIWINRRMGREGGGATPPSEVMPDLTLPDLASLASLVEDAEK
jgi:2-haloacid dehalogenase